MLRSLYTGVDGLKTHQTKMDVIGNNIANVNTVAYKSSSVSFKSLLYQTQQTARTANAGTAVASTNAKQIGLGTTVSSITSNVVAAGSAQNTGNPFDLRITGDSFFIVNDGKDNYFTKAGAFYVDAAGNLAMTSNGYNVMGWQSTDGVNANKGTVSALRIMTTANLTAASEATSNATVSGVLDKDSDGLSSADGETLTISFYDENGNPYTAKLAISKQDDSDTTGIYNLTLKGVIDDTTGKALTVGDGGTTTLSYSTANGEYTGGIIHMNIDASAAAGSTTTFSLPNGIDIDFSNSKLYGNNGVSTISATAGDADGLGTGRKVGELSGISIQSDGKIYGKYTNGTDRLLGQIAVATFKNPTGLEKVGENLYSATINSGFFDGVGVDITDDGTGSMTSGQLEMSNVDLAYEFTEMITTQRGFQVNSRVISVSDEMLQTLEGLKQ